MKIYNLILLGLIVVSAISCDKKAVEPEPDITINDFVGSWKAISHVLTNNSNSNEVIDLIANGGELRFTMLEHGGVRTWFIFDSFSDEWDSQTVLTNSNTIIVTPVEVDRGVNTFEFVLENNTLELTNDNVSFDFTLTGASEVPATSVTMYLRN